MTETMPTSEVLNRAADLIEERGWTTGADGMSPDGSFCMEGAIASCGGGEIEPVTERYWYGCARPTPAYLAVRGYLGLTGLDRVWQWNDARGRTASEVIEVLRACAVIEASREREPAEVSA